MFHIGSDVPDNLGADAARRFPKDRLSRIPADCGIFAKVAGKILAEIPGYKISYVRAWRERSQGVVLFGTAGTGESENGHLMSMITNPEGRRFLLSNSEIVPVVGGTNNEIAGVVAKLYPTADFTHIHISESEGTSRTEVRQSAISLFRLAKNIVVSNPNNGGPGEQMRFAVVRSLGGDFLLVETGGGKVVKKLDAPDDKKAIMLAVSGYLEENRYSVSGLTRLRLAEAGSDFAAEEAPLYSELPRDVKVYAQTFGEVGEVPVKIVQNKAGQLFLVYPGRYTGPLAGLSPEHILEVIANAKVLAGALIIHSVCIDGSHYLLKEDGSYLQINVAAPDVKNK